MRLADRLYVFCPNISKGIEFIVQPIPVVIQKLGKTLPKDNFLSSRVKRVSWDNRVNGDINNKVIIGTTNKELLRVSDSSYNAITLVVDRDIFDSLLYQIENPKRYKYNNHLVFSLSKKIIKKSTDNEQKTDDKN